MIKDRSKPFEHSPELDIEMRNNFPTAKANNTIYIFTFLNTAFGPGMLSLPHAIANFGLIPGMFMVVVGAGNIYISLNVF